VQLTAKVKNSLTRESLIMLIGIGLVAGVAGTSRLTYDALRYQFSDPYPPINAGGSDLGARIAMLVGGRFARDGNGRTMRTNRPIVKLICGGFQGPIS